MTGTISDWLFGVMPNETPQDTAYVGSICHASLLVSQKDSGFGGRHTIVSPNSTVVSWSKRDSFSRRDIVFQASSDIKGKKASKARVQYQPYEHTPVRPVTS